MTEPFQALPQALYSSAEVRAIDRYAIDCLGIPGAELMDRAGRRAFEAMRARWPEARRVTVVCGAGNNAGDGFVVARHAAEHGMSVTIVSLAPDAGLGADAAAMRARARGLGLEPEAYAGGALPDADVVVDAVLGTGAGRPVTGRWAEALAGMNEGTAPVLALDIPSGLDADTGRVLGTAARADRTVTFIGLKRGLFTAAGPEHAGELVFAGLGVPGTAAAGAGTRPGCRIDSATLAAALPARRRDAHKGTYGHVLVLGGAPGYAGAARMAAEAAARVGAGLVSVATEPSNAATLGIGRPELMVRGVAGPEALAPLLARASVVAVGPGLGQERWGETMLEAALAFDGPIVVDADGLNLLSRRRVRRARWVLTPHPAEAGRLLGADTTEIQADRFAAAREVASRFGGTCVLKGAGTVIATDEGSCDDPPWWLCSAGNPGLATGGTGDVLTGAIAGFLAQGFPEPDAAGLGVCAHAAAGDAAARAGERGMLAGDVLDALRSTVNPPAGRALRSG